MAFAVAALGIGLFSTMDALMKAATIALGVFNAVFWRNLVGILISSLLYLPGARRWPDRAALRVHLIRGAVSTVMAIAFFWGLARMPMAEAIALSFVAPIIALFLAAVLLGERIGSRAIAASLLGLAGVVVILSARLGGDGQRDFLGALAVLFSAMLYAYNIVLMRRQALIAGPREVAFSQSVIVTLCLTPFAPMFAGLPGAEHWPGLAAAAALACGSLLLLAWAYRRAEAQHLAPVEYTALVWAALFGYLVFSEQVGVSTLAGAGLIIGGCVLAARSRRPAAPAELTA